MISAFRPAPHIRHWRTTRWSMFLVVLLLLPIVITGYAALGGGVIVQAAILIGLHLAFELLANVYYRKWTILDGSILVSAFFLSLFLPQGLSIAMMVQLSFFSVIITKWLQGGLGFNYLNPTVIALLYALLAWPLQSTSHSVEAQHLWHGASYSSLATTNFAQSTALIDQLLSWILVIGAFIILCALGVVQWVVSLCYLLGYALFSYFIIASVGSFFDVMSVILEPRLLFFACFIAPNPSSLPAKMQGKLLYGFFMGVLVVLLMMSNFHLLALPLATLWMNVLSVVINYYTRGRSFSGVRLAAKVEEMDNGKE